MVLCNYRFYSYDPEKLHRTRKKFKQSFEKPGHSEVETFTEEVRTININKMTTGTSKTSRRLYYWDKLILVKMGKYKSINDVPDEIVISGGKGVNPELKAKVRAELLETSFKYFYGVDYFLWLLCGSFFICVYYFYKVGKPETSDKENKLTPSTNMDSE